MFAAVLLLAGAAHGLIRSIPGQDSAMDKNCTYKQAQTIMMYANQLATCANGYGCIDQEEQNRRRLADNDQMDFSPVERYGCYCSNCQVYMEQVQSACTACSAVNYCVMECDDDGNCACNDEADGNNNNNNNREGEGNFFQRYCLLDQMIALPYADTFCNMMSQTSSTCLQEMEYMVSPPVEEEDDDNNNNGRRRLGQRLGDNNNNNDDEEEVQFDAMSIASCWLEPFTTMSSQESYVNMNYCNQVCNMYSTYQFDYMSGDVPAQVCGFAVKYHDEGSEISDLVPHSIQHQGIMCMSSQCGESDLGYISEYLVGMAAYSQWIMFPAMEGQENNNRDNKNDEENQMQRPQYRVPETMGSWRCDGNGVEGSIENDNIPDECADANPSPSPEPEQSGSDGKWATAATFAVICGIGMGVFMCLFIYYFRQANSLKTGAAGQQQPLTGGATQQATSYQGNNAL